MAKKASPKKKASAKRLSVKLTSAAGTTVFAADFALSTPIKTLVQELRKEWSKVHKLVDESTNKLAMAFAEVYNPKYDDDLSGDLTVALDKDGKHGYMDLSSHKPRKAEPCKTIPVEAPAKPAAKRIAKPKAASATKGKSKADEVRDMIRANPAADFDKLLALAVDELGMAKGRARGYLKDNIPKIRG